MGFRSPLLPDGAVIVRSGVFDFAPGTTSTFSNSKRLPRPWADLQQRIPTPLLCRCFVDNTVAAAVLMKWRTASAGLATVCREIKARVSASRWLLCVAWVPSAQNPADGISRLLSDTADVCACRCLAAIDSPCLGWCRRFASSAHPCQPSQCLSDGWPHLRGGED